MYNQSTVLNCQISPLLWLPDEIILYMFGMLRSQLDLQACALVCRRLSRLALEVIWSEPYLYSEEQFNLWLIQLRRNTPPAIHDTPSTCAEIESSSVVITDGQLNTRKRPRGITKPTHARIEQIISDQDGPSRRTIVTRSQSTSFLSYKQPAPVPKESEPRKNYGKWIRNLYLDAKMVQPLITDMTLNRILMYTGRRLTRLDLSGCDMLGGHAFDFLAMSKRFARDHSAQMPLSSLVALSLQNCSNLTTLALVRLFQVTRQLEILNLNNVTQAVDDRVLQILAIRCNKLRGISLNGCLEVTDVGVSALMYNSPGMIEISMCDCVKVTDSSIRAIALSCPQLYYLRLTGCFRVTDFGLREVVLRCRRLQYFFVARCKVGDCTLLLFRNGSSLEYIDVAYSDRVTLSSLHQLLKSCSQLISLGLGACSQIISNTHVKRLSEPVPGYVPEHLQASYCVLKGQSIKELFDCFQCGMISVPFSTCSSTAAATATGFHCSPKEVTRQPLLFSNSYSIA